MRVLTIVKDLNLGGTQRVAQNLTIGLRDLGVEVALLARKGLGVRAQYIQEAEVPLFGPLGTDDNELEIALKWHPDIVHIHRSGYPDASEAALMRRFKENGALVVETNVFSRFDETIEAGLIDLHAHLSDWCLMKWQLWRGTRPGRGVVLSNAVETSRFARDISEIRDSTRANLGVSGGRFLLGRVGQPIPEKWNPAIFDVFVQGISRGWDLGLLLVGAPADYTHRVRNLPKSVQDRIILRDPVNNDDQLRNYYSALDGFLHLATIGESFGMVLCEAMLCEVPVVTLSTPLRDNSQLEVVGHGVGGYVASDQAGLIEAIGRLIESPGDRALMGKRARSSILERFAVPVVSAQAMQLYRELLTDNDRLPQPHAVSRGELGFSRQWRRQILSDSFGRPSSYLDNIAFKIAHNSFFYRNFRAIKKGIGRSASLIGRR